jgi:hypothetical protein
MADSIPYKEKFPRGSRIQIADRPFLEEFMTTWKYHHKLEPGQLAFAGKVTTVEDVSFYHGGDPIYKLQDAVGLWLEPCLRNAAELTGSR